VPVSYRIEPRLKCIFVLLNDTITDHELLDAQRDMFKDARFDGRYSRLITVMDVVHLALNADTVRSLATAAVHRGLRKAALVANGDFVYAMMQLYEGYAFAAKCQVFRNENEAATWLFSDDD
jgi:hypothetical protein